MKIELTCPDCNSTIRVEAIHSGKQVRCPVCSCISQVPVDGEVLPPPKPRIGDSSSNSPISGLPKRVGNTRNRRRDRRALDKRIVWAFIWAAVALGNTFFCCGPILGIVFSLLGLVQAVGSRSVLRQSGVVVNLIALAVSAISQIFNLGFNLRF